MDKINDTGHEVEILDYLRRGGNGAAFPELVEAVERRGGEARGDSGLFYADDLAVWAGLSDGFTDSVLALLARGEVHFHALGSGLEAFLVHSAHGEMLSFPMVGNDRPERGYDDPHWLPVVVHLGRKCGASNCLGKDASGQRR